LVVKAESPASVDKDRLMSRYTDVLNERILKVLGHVPVERAVGIHGYPAFWVES
jgi:hypothetical protein